MDTLRCMRWPCADPAQRRHLLFAALTYAAVCAVAPRAGLAAQSRTAVRSTLAAPYRSTEPLRRGLRPPDSNPLQYLFQGQPDGAQPYAGLVYLNGVFYGTTEAGGANNLGSVFSFSGGTEKVLHSFSGSDGANPYATLTAVNGVLFGTTYYGGTYGHGAVFEITTSGTEHVVYSFGTSSSTDGYEPDAGLLYYDGALYGTTRGGGTAGEGTVFKIARAGNGVKETILYNFLAQNDGFGPEAGLIEAGGVLYGTTASGGSGQCGTVFRVTLSGSEKTLHSFAGQPNDGCESQGTLLLYGGALYGTTNVGGSGEGTVFRLAPSGYAVVHNFNFTQTQEDGVNPEAGLLNVNGTFYGTTARSGPEGYGTVYSITPSGVETIINDFASEEFINPVEPMAEVIDVGGALYGTSIENTSEQGQGTIYAVPL